MASIYPMGGGGSPAFSQDTTARVENVVAGNTAVVSTSNDEAATGTLPKSAVLNTYHNIAYNGLLAINSSIEF